MTTIQKSVKELIRNGNFISVKMKAQPFKDGKEYYIPSVTIEEFINTHYPEYLRYGTELFKFQGKRVWLPYYLTKGCFTDDKSMLLPLKVIPIFE